MNKYIETLSSGKGVFIITIVLFVTLFLPMLLPPLFLIQPLIFLAFFLFVIRSLIKSPLAHMGWKIYLWIILLPTMGIFLYEQALWYMNFADKTAIGFLSGFALMFGLPFLLVGLYGLFRSNLKNISLNINK